MKTYKLLLPVLGLAVIGLLLFHPASVRLVKANSCTASTIGGTYGFAFLDGLGTSSRDVPHIGGFVPVAAAGTFSFNSGTGTVSRAFTFDFGGVITPGVSDSGPYTVNADCTGTATFPDVNETFNLVIVSGGNEIKFILTAPGTVTAGSMTKQ